MRPHVPVVGLLVVAGLVLGAVSCGVDDSLMCGAACDPNGIIAASRDGSFSDTPTVGSDGGVEASSKSDGAPTDGAPTDGNAACTATCPANLTCMGASCMIEQGPVCGAAITMTEVNGTYSGTVCAGGGTGTLTTTCAAPITSEATFVKFPGGNGPWRLTVSSVSGGLQVQVGTCATGTCSAVAPGGSTPSLSIGENSVVGIVSTGGCASFIFSYTQS